jgi:hypothetical protein
MNFKDSGKIKQIWILTTPLVVPITDDPDSETSNQLISRQEKFLKLSQGIKKKLSRVETSQKIQVIGQKYNFELLRLANITRLIREYYFGEVRLENFPAEIEKRMGVSLLTAQEITRYIKSEIIDWDPWAEYLTKLPKMSVREMFEKKLKIIDTEITSGYVELRGSEDLEDPTIKNWLQDYVSHLGYEKHSQMDRTQYLFHSENGRDLNSQDREKLGIILRSFDENIPLPVDEENGEIVFDELISEPQPKTDQPMADASKFVINTQIPKPQSTPDSFIKPYSPVQQPTKQTPMPARTVPTQNFVRPNPASSRLISGQTASKLAPQSQPPTQTPPVARIPYKATTSDPELNKYFEAPEASEIPEIKIHSMTEYNEPKPAPQVLPRPNIQRPVQTSPQPLPLRQTSSPPQPGDRPKYRVINPFEPRISEPKLDGNIVDLSNIEE